MSAAPLVLSLFPGIGLLDMAFEEAGFCVVRGPDLLWGGDIRRFHPPAGRFDGVIGGPPCKRWSPLANVVRAVHGEDSVAPDLIPEYERVVAAAGPRWFLMENVIRAPEPAVPGFVVRSETVNNRWCGGEQNRVRRFSFGTPAGIPLHIPTEALNPFGYRPAVTTNSGGRRKVAVLDENGRQKGKQGSADDARLQWRQLSEMAADQGVSAEFVATLQEHGAFTSRALRTGIGNGVPLPMGRAVAAAVRRALGDARPRGHSAPGRRIPNPSHPRSPAMSATAKNKPILCLDFDGVLHSYQSGWQGAAIIPDPPVPGAVEFLHAAVERFQVAIYSSRSGQPGGVDAMRGWLMMNLMAVIEDRREADHVFSLIQWPTEKPAATVTLDDRAITFDGHWPSMEALAAFQPWNKQPASANPYSADHRRPIDTAPLDQEVFVYCGEMRFRAKLVPGASMTMDEEPCGQWQATREGEHPSCWSEGACWASNADESPSLQPTQWSPVSPSHSVAGA